MTRSPDDDRAFQKLKSRIIRNKVWQWCERCVSIRQKRQSLLFGFAAVVVFVLVGVTAATASYAEDLQREPYRDPRATVVPVYQPGDPTPIAYYVRAASGDNMMCTRKSGQDLYTCVGRY
jgi:hypothetical protein